jgi:hypothetical protein
MTGVFAGTGTTGQYATLNASGKITFATLPTAPVTSVNGETGEITLSTTDIAEGTNLYFTNTRADARIGAATITGMTGVFDSIGTAGQYATLDANGRISFTTLPTAPVTSVNGETGAITLSTTDIAEGTNLYYTNTRVDSRISAANINTLSGLFNANGTTGQIPSLDANGKLNFINPPSGSGGGAVSSVNGETGTVVLTTADIAENTSLYFTNARADARINSATIAGMTGVFAGTGTEGAIASIDSNGKIAFGSTVARQQFKDVTGDYTLIASDHGKIIRITNTATITLPSGLFNGLQCTLFNMTSTVTTLTTSGTLQATSGIMRLQYVASYVTHVSNNTWIAMGRLD